MAARDPAVLDAARRKATDKLRAAIASACVSSRKLARQLKCSPALTDKWLSEDTPDTMPGHWRELCQVRCPSVYWALHDLDAAERDERASAPGLEPWQLSLLTAEHEGAFRGELARFYGDDGVLDSTERSRLLPAARKAELGWRRQRLLLAKAG